MVVIEDAIRRGLDHVGDERALDAIGEEIVSLCRRFLAYPRRNYGDAPA